MSSQRPTHMIKRFSIIASSLVVGILIGCAIASMGGNSGALSSVQAEEYTTAAPSIPDVIDRVSPSVVTVGAIKEEVRMESVYREYFSPFMLRPKVYRQKTPYMGSGFLIDDEGHILTNFHVIEDSLEIFITLNNGKEVSAKLIDADPFIDVALLKVDLPKEELPAPLEFADLEKLRIGETVLAIGNPFGNFIDDPHPTVTKGVVSAMHRSFRPDQQNLRVYMDMVQTDAAINPGNSGGPLIDDMGRVVGMNTFIVSPSGGSNGLGFAIPINRIKAMVDEIKKHGGIRPLLIDFQAETISTSRIQGVIIGNMIGEGPAEEAGLRLGDVLLSANGKRVLSRQELMLYIASMQVGDEVQFEVQRGQETEVVTYTIKEDKRL